MTAWSEGDVQANGITIHYYRTGGDKPPLILAHGMTDDGLCWTPVARALQDDYDVIMPDARGHGLSEAPREGYAPVDHAADLAGLIEGLDLRRPAIGGHSMGAMAALYLAALLPHLVRCALLEDPPLWSQGARPPTPADLADRAARARAEHEKRRLMTREQIIAAGRAANPTWAEEEFGPWADAKLRVSPLVSAALGGTHGPDWWDVLPSITCPTLLITADPQRGAIVTPETAREAQRLLPSLQVARIANAGHNIRREQFAEFMGVARAFLAGA